MLNLEKVQDNITHTLYFNSRKKILKKNYVKYTNKYSYHF